MTHHFEHEVELLAEAGRGICARHRAEHISLLEICSDALVLYDHDWRKTQSLLRNTFAKKVREHITSMDQCAVLMIHTDSALCDPLRIS
jgi:hemerythrin